MKNSEKIDLNQINNKYGALIEDTDFMSFGISDRLLPYSKQEIENALLAQAMYYKNSGDEKALNITTFGYVQLSLFISPEKYNIVKICYCPEGITALKNDEMKKQFMQIQEDILKDMKKRIATLNRVLGITVTLPRI